MQKGAHRVVREVNNEIFSIHVIDNYSIFVC